MILRTLTNRSSTRRLLLAMVLLCTVFGLWFGHATKTLALSASDFNPGRIIDNDIFTDASAMSGQEIQNFLNSEDTDCDTNGSQSISYYYNSSTGQVNDSTGSTWVTTTRAAYGTRYASWYNSNPYSGYVADESLAPYVCLRDYVENPGTGQNNLQNPSASISGGESAASIIYNAAQQYQINPEVILTTLQKEQGLITDVWPWTTEYTEAMGYNCPDTTSGAACSGFAGFYQQVDAAAKQYRNYLNNPDNYNYVTGKNTIDYAPPADGCSQSSTVNIQTQATAALYDYTPYQPDSNVLAQTNPTGSSAGAGSTVSGDACAAYGNRNFWWYFNTWFGESTDNASVQVTQYNATTDETGTAVTLGFSLSQEPTSAVTIPLSLSSGAPAEFSPSGQSTSSITIQPSNWNQPQLNTIVVYGLSSGNVAGGKYYTVMTGSLQTADPQYSLVTADYTPDITLLQEDNISTNVYRLYNSTTEQHYWTADETEYNSLVSDGWSSEGVGFSFCSGGENTVFRLSLGNLTTLVASNDPTLQEDLSQGWALQGPAFSTSRGAEEPVYMLYDPTSGDHLFTSSASEYNSAQQAGYSGEGVSFYACSSGQQPVYRLYDPSTGDHFYTTSASERDSAGGSGYIHEGVGFYLCGAGQTANVSVYRLYDPSTGDHFYTTSTPEESSAVKNSGYESEGTGFSMCSTTADPVYRLFDPQDGKHFYTPDLSEAKAAENGGYVGEGNGFYTTP